MNVAVDERSDGGSSSVLGDAIALHLVTSLRNMKTLHLCLDQHCHESVPSKTRI